MRPGHRGFHRIAPLRPGSPIDVGEDFARQVALGTILVMPCCLSLAFFIGREGGQGAAGRRRWRYASPRRRSTQTLSCVEQPGRRDACGNSRSLPGKIAFAKSAVSDWRDFNGRGSCGAWRQIVDGRRSGSNQTHEPRCNSKIWRAIIKA
jgi:hypothetical protein